MYAIFPVANWEAVTPSDTAKLTFNSKAARCRAVYIGGAGDLEMVNEDGTVVVLVGLQAGVVYPISTDHIKASNTTATDIIAGYDSPKLS